MIASLVLSATLAAASPKALVVSFQALGVEDADVARLAAALRADVETRGWVAVDADLAARQVKAATMCGEDASCLATLGTRCSAEWVLAFSAGKVGKGLVITTVLVETVSGQRRAGSTEKPVAMPEDLTNLARALVDPLFRDVPSLVVLNPGPPAEAPPMVAAEPRSKLGPVAAGVLIGSGVIAVGGAVLTVVAGNNFTTLQSADAAGRPSADATQRALNISADVTVGVAIAAAATGLVLLIANAVSSSAPAEQPEAEVAQ